ncbi:MAG: sugar transferase [Rubinisphaera brasiliensis]|uniref:sugar transferase n=1 Tax=Rubinisphaera brasiliensis TaxID=119 RepID=UPI00391C8E59
MIYRAFDIFLTLIILILASPVMLIIAVILRLREGAPILFRQERVGADRKTFSIYKFRTMRNGSNFDAKAASTSKQAMQEERAKMRVKSDKDPRITAIGAILRKTHLDELPQLFNVLRGDLSLVGVRPDTPLQEDDYPEGYWEKRHRYAPGITGPDQMIRSSDIAGRVQNETLWLEGRSLGLYLRYLGSTPLKMLKRTSF